MEREGEEQSQICSECGESVPVKQVKRHNLRRHDKREYVCEICGITSVGYEKNMSHKVCKLLYFFLKLFEQDLHVLAPIFVICQA